MKVQVIDALMGSGKTEAAIRMMGEIDKRADPFQTDTPTLERFIYITPFLSEVAAVQRKLRAKVATIALDPDNTEHATKIEALKMQAYDGQNIVSTHALFSMVDDDAAACIRGYRYTLMIDEVADWVHEVQMSAADYIGLTKAGVVTVEPNTDRVVWHDDATLTLGDIKLPKYKGAHHQFRRMCKLGRVYLAKATQGAVFLVYQFPVELLRNFERVYVLTHLYDGSLMAAFLRLHDVHVEKYTIAKDRETVIPYDAALEAERVKAKAARITVVQDPELNKIGKTTGRTRPLSKSWFENDAKAGREKAKALRNMLYNWLRHTMNASTSSVIWSTYSSHADTLVSKLATFVPTRERRARHYDDHGVLTHNFVAFNARASNHWRTRNVAAYLVNLHNRRYLAEWFRSRGMELSDDYYALTSMAQWLFRSAIRDNDPVTVWVPSDRMRGLLLDWLAGKLPEGARFATIPVADFEKQAA